MVTFLFVLELYLAKIFVCLFLILNYISPQIKSKSMGLCGWVWYSLEYGWVNYKMLIFDKKRIEFLGHILWLSFLLKVNFRWKRMKWKQMRERCSPRWMTEFRINSFLSGYLLKVINYAQMVIMRSRYKWLKNNSLLWFWLMVWLWLLFGIKQIRENQVKNWSWKEKVVITMEAENQRTMKGRYSGLVVFRCLI